MLAFANLLREKFFEKPMVFDQSSDRRCDWILALKASGTVDSLGIVSKFGPFRRPVSDGVASPNRRIGPSSTFALGSTLCVDNQLSADSPVGLGRCRMV